MTNAQFTADARDILKNYWRVKAANALYRSSPHMAAGLLEYANIPAVGLVTNVLATEPAAEAMLAMRDFVAQRLPRDLLLALIAQFESRITARLTSLRQPVGGTLGSLHRRIERKLRLPTALIQELVEVRERRNAMIHHGDIAGPEYVTASALVLPRSAPFVKATIAGDNISPNDEYLTYAADVLVRYSNAIG